MDKKILQKGILRCVTVPHRLAEQYDWKGEKMSWIERLKPSVSRWVLLLFAGLLWIGAGSMLLTFAFRWLHEEHPRHVFLWVGAGVLGSLLIHHFGFLQIVDKNLNRILPIDGKRCFFSFMPWKSYILIVLMMSIGMALRHLPIPRQYLASLYIAIGLALILSSIRYFRFLILLPRGRKKT